MPRAHHVGLTVDDLDRAVEFYRETFNFAVLSEFSVSGEAFATGVDVAGAEAEFVHLDADGIRLELVSYEPAGGDAAAAAINDTGAKHIGFEVGDLDAFYEGLAPSVETLSEPQTTDSGTRICFIRDPEDTLVEVLEP